MSVDEAVARTARDHPELIFESARSTPKAWGALAAQGIVAFREVAGRPPNDTERRAIWSGLWKLVEARRA